jgi:hypothetical protein
MDSVEFSVQRIHMLMDDRQAPAFLAEIAFLYDHIVQTGTHEPVIDLGMKLMIPFDQVGDMVVDAMSYGYISAPKRGTWGGAITQKALKVLGQIEPKKRRKRIDSISCPSCGEKTLKKILYGMPGDDFDFQKYFVGGCAPSAEDIGCKNCEWVGIRDEMA